MPVVGLERAIPNNLPDPLTEFVGRARERAELAEELPRARVLTLTGPGGCGKSRLAARVAADQEARFPDGARWVELAGVSDAAAVGLAIARALGVRPGPGQDGVAAAVSRLAARRCLVVLDNCEHVLDAAAHAARALATGCPDVVVLATSREPLHIAGETEWRVPPMTLPEPDGSAPSDAVDLFVTRARRVRTDFRLSDRNRPAVARLCRELDGMPLAIELAAARSRVLSVWQIADGLSDRFRVLGAAPRSGPDRHRTLRASVDWSHTSLSDAERILFRRAGVFAGGFTLEAAERVCAGADLDAGRVLELLAALVDKSLVQAEEHGEVVRYRLLETIRHYALERLADAGEVERLRERHLTAYLELAERIAPELLTARQEECLRLLDPEAANLAQAIAWGAEHDPERALRLTVDLTFWWRLRGRLHEGEAAYAKALGAGSAPTVPRARALWSRGFLLTLAGRFAEAGPVIDEALAAARACGDRYTLARGLLLIGTVTVFVDPAGAREPLSEARRLTPDDDLYATGIAPSLLAYSHLHQTDPEPARPYMEEARRYAEKVGNPELLAWARGTYAWFHVLRGDHVAARDDAVAAERYARAVGDVVTELVALSMQAGVDTEAGRPDEAIERLTAGRARAVSLGAAFVLAAAESWIGLAHASAGRFAEARSWLEYVVGRDAGGYAFALIVAYAGLAEVLWLRGDLEDAERTARAGQEAGDRIGERYFGAWLRLTRGRLAAVRADRARALAFHHEALSTITANGFRPLLPQALEALGQSMAVLGEPREAARVLGAAERHRDETGYVAWRPHRTELAATMAGLRTALGDDAFADAVAEGRGMTVDEALAYVRGNRGPRGRPATGWDSLTPAEAEVAALAAAGLTNPEIAARKFISRSTVKAHLAHVYAKLGLQNRAELAAAAARRTEAPPAP